MKSRLWDDFTIFAKAQLKTKDIDPAYPVLKAAFDAGGLDEETRLWHLLIYLTYYSLASAEKAWTRVPSKEVYRDFFLPALPTGIERRGMRGNDTAVNHFVTDALGHANGNLTEWMHGALIPSDPKMSWRQVRDRMGEVWGAGSWATYKWADLMKNVMGYPITANDIGLGGGSATAGPVPGLALLLGIDPSEVVRREDVQWEAYEVALERGVTFQGIEEFETSLCDFNSLFKGGYYVGHDIDLMQESLPEGSVFWAARRMALPAGTMGEHSGWSGVRKDLKTTYRDSGVIVGAEWA